VLFSQRRKQLPWKEAKRDTEPKYSDTKTPEELDEGVVAKGRILVQPLDANSTQVFRHEKGPSLRAL
jgi:hypothetical protein